MLIAVALLVCPQAGSSELEASLETPSKADRAHLFGHVTTRDGKEYRGYFRWRGGELFWNERFDSNKADIHYVDQYQGDGKKSFEILGRKFSVGWGPGRSRRDLAIPFGLLSRIEPRPGDEALVALRDGTELQVEDGSDVGGELIVVDPELGEIQIEWRNIESIQFLQATTAPGFPVSRLTGEVTTSQGSFTGYILWDQQEKLGHEELDGDVDKVSLSIAMGRIQSIERVESRASRVTLLDGRVLELSGTNDVNDENRGIVIEDPRYGSVTVRWPAFERLDLETSTTNGPTYDEMAVAYNEQSAGEALRGTVTRRDGTKLSGAIVYDLDKVAGWERLEGRAEDISYSVPFHLVRALEPNTDGGAWLTLVGGQRVELKSGRDVGEENGGVLVLLEDGSEVLVPWSELARLELES